MLSDSLLLLTGGTVTDDDSDLSLDTLSNDLVVLLKALYGDKMPVIFLVGHR
jgi:protein phosphatase methylesterase 1